MRRFEFTDDKSAKFWEIEQADTDLNIRWGRIGTAGQSQTKNFADASKAAAAMQKLVTEKTGKGYAEAGVAAGAVIGKTATKEVSVAAASNKTLSAEPELTVPTAAVAEKPPENIDHQIQRAFTAICTEIAEGKLSEQTLTVAKIRRAHDISELAAHQVIKQLSKHNLISSWSGSVFSQSQLLAKTLMREAAQVSSGADAQDIPAASSLSSETTPPWLLQGQPLQFSDAPGMSVREQALASRRFPQPVAEMDAQRAWLQLRQDIVASKDPDFAGSDAGLRDIFEASWQTLSSPKLSGTPETDAVLLVLSLDNWGRNKTYDVAFVNYLIARHGLPYAIDTLIKAQSMAANDEYVGRNAKDRQRLSHTVETPWKSNYYGGISNGEICLRNHLAKAEQSVYDICLEKVKAALPQVAPVRQTALALLFPDAPELSHDTIYRLCAAGVNTPAAVHMLQMTATDPAALALARKVKPDGVSNFCSNQHAVNTVLLERGVEATLWLAHGASQAEAGDALTRIGTPEAVEALARVASTSKDAMARLMLAVERWPAAAIAALTGMLSGNSKDQSLLQPTLIQLLRSKPDLASAVQAWLEPAGKALITRLQERLAGPSDIAKSEDLPEVLTSPPWLQAKKKTAQVLQLKPLSITATEYWAEGEKESAQEIYQWQRARYQAAATDSQIMAIELSGARGDKVTPEIKKFANAIKDRDLPAMTAIWRSTLEEKKKERYYYYYLDVPAVAHLPPEIGIPFWNAIASEVSCSGVAHIAAKWGLDVLPGVIAKIQSAPTDNIDIALHFGAAELAPIAARAYAKLKTLRGMGKLWLKRYPEHAACGLIATALGKPSEARDCAASALRWLAANGHAALLDEVAGRYEQPEVLTALHAMLNESPLDRYPAKRPALPEFWQPSGWNRPVLLNGKALPDASLAALGSMMMFPTNEEVYAGLPQVKAACTPQSLADFAWDCFSAWLNSGAPSKEGWALTTLGILGTNETARMLTPYLRAWPGESAHARAVTGLDVLASIGTDVALMLLNGIAQKVKFKGLQDKAREKISDIAEARGLTPEELEDRLAPDLGLDEQGSMVLDFGPRAYKVGFDESLKPYVREWLDGKAGARLPDLPKPKKTDDEAMAKDATERFKLLKKDARTIASQQVLRLEVAMCMRRRWTPEVFAQFLASHPLVRHLVRRLVWAVYLMPEIKSGEIEGENEDQEITIASYGGELQTCFRVSEDGEYTTAQDDSFVLPEGEHYKIGLPHALELPAGDAAEFAQLLADYELLQPFAQLGRDTYALSDEEKAAKKLLRWKDQKVPTGKILGLVNIGWRRGPAQDSGCIWTFEKPQDSNKALELTLDPGIIVGLVDEYPEQTLGEITLGTSTRWGNNDNLHNFAALDSIAASELIRDMERLKS